MKKIKSLISLLITLSMLVSMFAVSSVSADNTVTEGKVILDMNFEDGATTIGTIKDNKGIGGVAEDTGYSKALKLNENSHFLIKTSEAVTSGKVLVSMDYRVACHSMQMQVFPQFGDSTRTDIWSGGGLLAQVYSKVNSLYINSDSNWLGAVYNGEVGKTQYSNLTYLLDLTNKKMDVYHDGALYFQQLDMGAADNFQTMVFRICNGSNGTKDSGTAEYWIDNLKATVISKTVTEIPCTGCVNNSPSSSDNIHHTFSKGTEYRLKYSGNLADGIYTFSADFKTDNLKNFQLCFMGGVYINLTNLWNSSGNVFSGNYVTDFNLPSNFAANDFAKVEFSLNNTAKSSKITFYDANGAVAYTKVLNGLFDATATTLKDIRIVSDGADMVMKNIKMTKIVTEEKFAVTSVKNGDTVVTEGSTIVAKDGLTVTFPEPIADGKLTVVNNDDVNSIATVTASTDGKIYTVSNLAGESSYTLTVAKDAAAGFVNNMDNDYVLNFETSFLVPESKVLLDMSFEDGATTVGTIKDNKGIGGVAEDTGYSKALKLTTNSHFLLKASEAVTDGKVLVSMDYRVGCNSQQMQVFPQFGDSSRTDIWSGGGVLGQVQSQVESMYFGAATAENWIGAMAGRNGYSNLTYLLDLTNNVADVYHDGIHRGQFTLYDTTDFQTMVIRICDGSTVNGKDSGTAEYWLDNVKVVTVPSIKYIGGTYKTGSENLALTKGLNEEFNFTEAISDEYFDEDGILLSEYANLFTLKKNGTVLNAADYSVELDEGKRLVVNSKVAAGDSFVFTMSKDVNVSGYEALEEDFVHTVSFDANPIVVNITEGDVANISATLNVEGYKVIVAEYEGETLLKSVEIFDEGDDISAQIARTDNTIIKVMVVYDDNILRPFVDAIVK